MNSKSEWNSSRIPRIVIEEEEKLKGDETSELGRKVESSRQTDYRTIYNRQF